MSTEVIMPSQVYPELAGILTILVLGIATINPGIDRHNRRYLLAYFSALALGGIIFAIDIITYMDPKMLFLTNWICLMGYAFYLIPYAIMSLNLSHHCDKDLKKSRFLLIKIALWVIYYIILLIGHFTNLFYYTLPDGRFFRKPTHPLLLVPLIVSMILDLMILLLNRRKLSRNYFWTYLAYIIPVIVATFIHSFVFSVVVVNIALLIGSISLYILTLTDQVDKYISQQTAIANQNANILVLQMRPHFIYNTMTSIYYLCEQNPKMAQQVILDFTSYLRKNFNAIASSELIPFNYELEHVRAFLSVELAQFEDNLMVEYDTPHTQFCVPPLTIEPIVENAIKHGLDPDSDPLRILIRTAKTASGNIVTIKDTGPGFDPTNVFESNNALSNIKQRLKLMCDGSITITSHEGEGTTVEIIIPDNPNGPRGRSQGVIR